MDTGQGAVTVGQCEMTISMLALCLSGESKQWSGGKRPALVSLSFNMPWCCQVIISMR